MTGIDWAEPMLELARAKAKTRGRRISFRLGDAENTMEPDNHYDVIINRHLVWTLVDPEAAFAEWLRVLKPGGTLLIVDGDFVNSKPVGAASVQACRLGSAATHAKRDLVSASAAMMDTHRSILSRVYFSQGARAEAVADLLLRSGFENVTIDTDLARIHRAQAKHWNLFKGLARGIQHRYAIRATKAG